MIGSTIGHYRIVEKLGEGGMGVVYKAEDAKLERIVALKFLAAHLLNDEEAKHRFLREAKAAAALHHPNICPVYEIDEVDGKTFISMAFIEGQTLEDRIAEGPLAIKDALDLARQVADGLQAAHSGNVVHRDIKPANVIVSSDGRATIMDFGLARLTEASRLTQVDTAMGTVAYMSPEQAQGAQVDHRSDVWSLGCVLYEMVAGQRPFTGQYDQALLYEIVHEEPEPLTGVRSGVPMELEFVVGKCLAKERDDRTASAQEVSRELRTLSDKLKSGRSTILRTGRMTGAVPAAADRTLNPVVAPPMSSNTRIWQGLFAVLMLAFLGLLGLQLTETSPEPSLQRISYVPPPSLITGGTFAGLAVSPDGRHIAYATEGVDSGLWVQDLDQDGPRQLAGTEDAVLPFWSPDSEFIAYAAHSELRKISVNGGASGLICPLPNPLFLEGTWSPDGELIVFSSYYNAGGVLFTVSSQGGSPEQLLTAADLDQTAPSASRPRFAAGVDDPVLLFTVGTDGAVEMYAMNLDTGQTAALGLGDRPAYSPKTGHLIYQPERGAYDLWARSFSPETFEFTGPAFPLRQNARQPSASNDGALAYMDGIADGDQTLVWRNRAGEILEAVGQPGPIMAQPALSPDGGRVAVRSGESGNADIWVHDLTRSTKTRLTFADLHEATPAWSSSGREILYRLASSRNRIMSQAADGTGEPATLVEAEYSLFAPDRSHDNRYLVFHTFAGETDRDIRYVEFEDGGGGGAPVAFLDSEANEGNPKLSPTGGFIAYVSDEAGRNQVFVRSFPSGEGKWQISANGGRAPRWRGDGKELYYLENDAVMAVSVSTEGAFQFEPPQRLFEAVGLDQSLSGLYDVSADGQRFITIEPVSEGGEQPKIRLVQNWYEEFRVRQED